MIAVLHLPDALHAQIEHEARTAFPRECCGLIEGTIEGDAARAVAVHVARNLSGDNNRFEIDPADHFRILRSARANGHAIVGCYHSHPNGKAEPSLRDRDGALDEDFIWVVCGIDAQSARTAAFVFENNGFRALDMRQTTSA